MLAELETEILKKPEDTERDIFMCTVRSDISRMVYQEVQNAIRAEIMAQLEAHQTELREQVNKLVSTAISKMKISVPSLTVSLTASEDEYDL